VTKADAITTQEAGMTLEGTGRTQPSAMSSFRTAIEEHSQGSADGNSEAEHAIYADSGISTTPSQGNDSAAEGALRRNVKGTLPIDTSRRFGS
jgi:hypothetical protein